jgi:hypothetical protein
MIGKQALRAGQALIFDDPSKPLIARAVGDARGTTLGHFGLVAGRAR